MDQRTRAQGVLGLRALLTSMTMVAEFLPWPERTVSCGQIQVGTISTAATMAECAAGAEAEPWHRAVVREIRHWWIEA